MLGKTVGRYEILSEIGRGANGVVWKARHSLLPTRLVALKVLSENLWTSPQARERFLREAIAVSKLDHPNIATLYDAEEVDGRLYIAFKLVDGESVATRMANGALSIADAVRVARDAAEGLSHAHAHGVVHRDISPGNIMIDRGGRGVLVDFGLARAGEQSTTATVGAVAGTLHYMAPEALRGNVVDARSDTYSLGAVLYRMITGDTLFEGRTSQEIMYQVLNGRVTPPSKHRPEVPSELDDAVLRAVERDPRDRYTAVDEFSLALAGVLARPGVQDGTPASGSRLGRALAATRRAIRRRPSRRILMMQLAACALAVAVGIAWTRGWRLGLTTHVPVVAVLPVQNTSEDPVETAYLGEALGQELVSRLGQVSSMRLVPWMTSQRFRDTKAKPQDVARELHADKLVVGSYRSDGERVKVTMTLVDARSGLQAWSQVYEESVDDLFSLQQGVATGIAAHLGERLTQQDRDRLGTAASTSPEAYEWYLRGASFMNSPDPATIAMAGPYFDKALEIDPKLAAAWVGVGAVKADLFFRGLAGMADLAVAERAFLRALELDPKLYAAERGLVQVYEDEGQRERALGIARRHAAEVNGPEALLVRAWAYTSVGLPEVALPIFERVLELDPANQAAAWYRVIAASWAGRLDTMDEYARSYMQRFGEDPELYDWLAVGLYARGRPAAARASMVRALELFGDEQSNLYSVVQAVALFQDLGERERADSLAEHWLANLDGRIHSYPDNGRLLGTRATLATWAGHARGGLDIDRLVSDRHYRLEQAGVIDILGSVRDLARVRALCESVSEDEAEQYITGIRAGSLKVAFGPRYPEVERLPEFRAFLERARTGHAKRLARA